jgi:hypothetical protein
LIAFNILIFYKTALLVYAEVPTLGCLFLAPPHRVSVVDIVTVTRRQNYQNFFCFQGRSEINIQVKSMTTVVNMKKRMLGKFILLVLKIWERGY